MLTTALTRAAASGGPAAAARGVGLVWYKVTDLRVHDHEPLVAAHRAHDAVAHVFCFDPRWFVDFPLSGFQKTGYHRARFMSEAVADLRRSLEARGSSLLVRVGHPEDVVPPLAEALGAHAIYSHSEVCSEERSVDRTLRTRLAALRAPPRWVQFWGNTLYHVEDLPFRGGADEYPDIYSTFRRAVEAKARVRPPLPTPPSLRPLPASIAAVPSQLVAAMGPVPPTAAEAVVAGRVPSASELGVRLPPGWQSPPSSSERTAGAASASILDARTSGPAAAPKVAAPPPAPSGVGVDSRAAVPLVGGETAALHRLETYVWARDRLREYKETRNGMVGADYSSKFSPWLAFGCLSPRLVSAEVDRYERERVANDSTYWLRFELLWRDYFRFLCIKWGNSVFHLDGPRGKAGGASLAGSATSAAAPRTARAGGWRREPALIAAWTTGKTGYPFVDACMRELRQSGFMSNRGRQNVASFLTRDMGVDWRIGAEWFESMLVDHDPCSNYGNWTYVAGVGSDPREDRYFSIPKQSRTYDPDAAFMQLWCPELCGFATDGMHTPQRMDPMLRASAGYPAPIVPLLFASGGGGGHGGGGHGGGGGGSGPSAAGDSRGGSKGGRRGGPHSGASGHGSGSHHRREGSRRDDRRRGRFHDGAEEDEDSSGRVGAPPEATAAASSSSSFAASVSGGVAGEEEASAGSARWAGHRVEAAWGGKTRGKARQRVQHLMSD